MNMTTAALPRNKGKGAETFPAIQGITAFHGESAHALQFTMTGNLRSLRQARQEVTADVCTREQISSII
ncbi:hypothetical protein AB0F46_42200 [Streptomyces sp. NPDC026665]|uniref:hypothetical protein n=1 Tax=Streptomyces sp. NPDC026665 TaxID=3154798 RepID=UPI0034028E54